MSPQDEILLNEPDEEITHIHDTDDNRIVRGSLYKIRTPNGQELCTLPINKDLNMDVQLFVGPANSGDLFYIEQKNWPNGSNAKVYIKGPGSKATYSTLVRRGDKRRLMNKLCCGPKGEATDAIYAYKVSDRVFIAYQDQKAPGENWGLFVGETDENDTAYRAVNVNGEDISFQVEFVWVCQIKE